MRERSCRTDRSPRREILFADLDRLSTDRLLFFTAEAADAEEAASRRRDALHEAVRRAVQTELTDKQRRVVEAYFFEGLSQGEIARQLGISQQVVHKCLYGASRGGRTVGGALRRLELALAPLYLSHPIRGRDRGPTMTP